MRWRFIPMICHTNVRTVPNGLNGGKIWTIMWPHIMWVKKIQPRFWLERSRNFCVADAARATICLCILWYAISTSGSLQVCSNRFRWHPNTLPRFSFKRVQHLDLRRFVFTFYFRTHERRHRENTKTESCPFCTATFEHKFHLKQHIKRKHNAEMPAGARDNVDLEHPQNSASNEKRRLRRS